MIIFHHSLLNIFNFILLKLIESNSVLDKFLLSSFIMLHSFVKRNLNKLYIN